MTDNTKLLRTAGFGLTALLVLILICATVAEKLYGTAFVSTFIYGSPLFVTLWGTAAVFSLLYLIRRKLPRRTAAFLLHLAFLIILAGALTTHIRGIQGSIHLRHGEQPLQTFTNRSGENCTLPFAVGLKDFELAYYPGTQAPMDFISTLTVHDQGYTHEGKVSMNRIYSYRHYRFYQSTYDADGKGSTLSISYDPYGIAVTYAGYWLLLLSCIAFFFEKDSRFRQLLRHPSLRKAASCMLLLAATLPASAAGVPKTLPRQTADRFGNIYVYYNDRICPLQTLARDFTLKLYGKDSYKGMTPEQVLTGWFFYYNNWKEEPIIRIKSSKIRQLLDTDKEYVRLTDFVGPKGYKLEQAQQTLSSAADRRALDEANEKFNLVSMICTGNALRIYPYRENADNQPVWYSIADPLPASMPHEQWAFVRYGMNYMAEKIAQKDYTSVEQLLDKTREYQEKEAGTFLPSPARFRAEKLYNALSHTRPLAMACLTIGILSFVFYCRRMSRQGQTKTWVSPSLLSLAGIILLYLITVISLRGFVSGHLPVSNGFETMQFMAACVLTLMLFFHRRFEAAIAFGYMLCGLALLVSLFGESNPPITQLMPVLSSPLLSLHVVTIMIAYSLLAFVMLNGVTAIVLHYSRKNCESEIERLYLISQILLYPAVFCLTAGIFIGAVWANVSWGRYWGWDPKEVWALITMLVYASALHPSSLPAFRRPMFFHGFAVIAFLSVLITYFGVNFIMGGMHSYA